MKVLMVAPYFYPKTGGMENYAWHIAKGLKETFGWEVVAVSANHEIIGYSEDVISGIKIYRLPTTFKASNTPINLNWHAQLQKIIEVEKPDLINGHTPVPYISDIAARVASKKGIPFVLTYQNDLVKENKLLQSIIQGYYFAMGIRTGQLATKIITTSDYYPTISNYLKKFAKKIAVVSPGVEFDFYESITPTQRHFDKYGGKRPILFVGQLDRTHTHKGLHLLIDAVAAVVNDIPEIHLIVVGKGDMVDEYKSYAKAKGLKNNFEIITNAGNKELVEYYKLSEITILPSISKSEGFGMVLLEANACKKPVIGSRIGGIPFVIQDKKTGLLVPPGDTKALQKAITRLLTDKPFAKELGTNGYERIKHQFTWPHQIQKTNKIFEQILKL